VVVVWWCGVVELWSGIVVKSRICGVVYVLSCIVVELYSYEVVYV